MANMRGLLRAAFLAVACAGAVAAWGGAGAIAAQGQEGETAAGSSSSDALVASETQGVSYLDVENAASGMPFKSAAFDDAGPIVTELADGRMVQRTPSEDISTSLNASGAYSHPGLNTTYNCDYLQADARGCGSCHDDLAALMNAASYGHTDLTNDMGIDINVNMCVDCHEVGDGYQTTYYDFGTLIHGIHRDVADADCMSCHNYTEDGEGFTLWDASKHSLMRGITSVPAEELEGDFTWNQDVVVEQGSVFNWQWYYLGSDYLRNSRAKAGEQPNESIYRDWTITVSGEVGKEVSYTIADLLEQAPVETRTVTMQCTYNPTGGPYIANCQITGVPLDWLIEQAGGLTDAAYGMYTESSDGNANSMLVENLQGKDAMVVFQIDGETLSFEQGFPAMMWVGGTGAPINCKELSDIVFVDEADEGIWEYNGWTDDGEYYYNKPNVGIMGTPEGLCLQSGEPYTFKGYASAFDKDITSIQFSMDGGESWIDQPIEGADINRWVYWEFTWTSPADTNTAYVLLVRSIDEEGAATADPIEVMVNTKEDLAAFAEQARSAQGGDSGLLPNQSVVPSNIEEQSVGAPGTIVDDPQGYADGLSPDEAKANFSLLLDAASDSNRGE